MKLFSVISLMFLTLNTYAAPTKKSPTLAGQCKDKAIVAANKVLVIDGEYDFNDDEIEADEETKNVYGFNYSDRDVDMCYYRAFITIKPTKIDKKKNQVLECEIISAEDDGEPNCG